jgi:hypothetical protein
MIRCAEHPPTNGLSLPSDNYDRGVELHLLRNAVLATNEIPGEYRDAKGPSALTIQVDACIDRFLSIGKEG